MLYTSLLTGEVKAFRYDEETGESSSSSGSWTARPSKRTARTLDIERDGKGLWMGGKGGGLLYVVDPGQNGRVEDRDSGDTDTVIVV